MGDFLLEKCKRRGSYLQRRGVFENGEVLFCRDEKSIEAILG